MRPFDRDDLERRGFVGFLPIAGLGSKVPSIPTESGVYAVIRETESAPMFLERCGGGWFKGKDPSVSLERLTAKWVVGVPRLYIGRASKSESRNLQKRIGKLAAFSEGRPVAHWGGRLLWQVEDCNRFLVAWKVEPDFAALEADLLDEFVDLYGHLPFANLRR